MLLEGKGVEKDCIEAVKWIQKAAENGSDNAQYTLGLLYSTEENYGISKDFSKAFK